MAKPGYEQVLDGHLVQIESLPLRPNEAIYIAEVEEAGWRAFWVLHPAARRKGKVQLLRSQFTGVVLEGPTLEDVILCLQERAWQNDLMDHSLLQPRADYQKMPYLELTESAGPDGPSVSTVHFDRVGLGRGTQAERPLSIDEALAKINAGEFQSAPEVAEALREWTVPAPDH